MQALQVTGYGAISENLVITEVPELEILDDEVLIEIHAASLNPHDYKTVQGEFRRIEKIAFPASIGTDASGVIIKKGESVTDFNVGDEVFGIVEGAIASHGKARRSQIAHKPQNLTHIEAASLPLVGMTTIQAFECAKVAAGDKILIHAGAGGIGSFAIQYAKSLGAFVYSTTSSPNASFVKLLGADVVIDYLCQSCLDIARDLDFVYDTLGGQNTFDAFSMIRPGGRIVSLLPAELTREVAIELGLPSLTKFIFSLKPSKIARLKKAKNAFYKFLYVDVERYTDLLLIAKLANEGKIAPIVDVIFPFSESIRAFEYLAKGRTRGKVVVRMKD
jgi:hypothetical protein